MITRHKNSGFTLIEVLVAMTVMAVSLAVLFRIMTATNLGVRSSAEYRQALAIAQSKMAELVASERVSSGEWEGATGTMRWRQRVAAATGMPLAVASNGYALRRLEVEVAWQSGRARRVVTLNTLRFRNDDF